MLNSEQTIGRPSTYRRRRFQGRIRRPLMTGRTGVAMEQDTAPDATRQVVLRIVRQVLGRPGIGLDDDLFDHGATSLSFVRVLAQIHQELGVMVHAAALGGVATPRNLAACVTAEPAVAAASRGV